MYSVVFWAEHALVFISRLKFHVDAEGTLLHPLEEIHSARIDN